jgi:hypothetical protein
MGIEMITTTEEILYGYVCGSTDARDTKKLLKLQGWKGDLRKWIGNIIELENIQTGELKEFSV